MYPIIQETEHYTVTEKLLPMSDGICLYTRCTIPKGAKKYPTVFIRTPYDPPQKGNPCTIDKNVEAVFVSAGYAVVRQHCRGTGDSDGFCLPYSEKERSDGLDTLALIREMPFYNGEIFLWGGSYLASVHYLYLDTAPADIKGAVFAIQTDRMYFHKYRNGCVYDPVGNTNWYLDRIRRKYPAQDRSQVDKRPYINIMPRVIGTDIPRFADMMRNDHYNDFWKNDPRTHLIENLKLPVLWIDGWYDFYLGGMYSMWQRLPEKTKAKSAFLIGPWGHATQTAKNCPYPLPDGNIPVDYAAQWFESIRQKTPYPYAKTGKITYYSIGGGNWSTANTAISPRPEKTLYFRENLTLVGTPDTADTQITYRYDPDNAPCCFRHNGIFPGHAPNSVPGVITFLSEPAEYEQRFLGPVHWHMTVSSDCDDTAFFLRVSMVENGVSYNLTQLITSLSHIAPDCYAGIPITIDLDTTPIAFTLKKGCQLRVDISSHSDIFAPHANVKGHWAEVTETKIANNTLHLKDAYIALPIE